jgi:alpha-L-fucosidase
MRALALLLTLLATPPPPVAPPDPAKEQRLAWFREAKFGLFIHWGLYAVPAGRWKGVDYPFIGEWIMKWAHIPAPEYEGLARQWNPRKFDAEAVAQLAKDAGMKYVVLTAKHHDGFAMFDSKATRYDVVDATPWKRDPARALARAVTARGLKFGFYYSQAQDWHEPDAAGNTWDFTTPPEERTPASYLRRKAMPQVEELLGNYGPLGLVWFDTPTLLTKEQVTELEALVRRKQPACLINSRLGHGLGDYRQMGDNMVPSDVYRSTWEIPATLNDTWGFKTADQHWKSTAYLLYRLIDVVSKGGNYLLNVGPAADGSIPAESVQRLRELGRWLDRHGEAIYGTGPSPFSVNAQPWRMTTRPGLLYVHLLRWPAGGRFRLDGLRNPITGAYLLSDPARKPLDVERAGATTIVHLPGDAPDPYIAVLALKIEGEPDVDPAVRWDAPRPQILLAARDGSAHGASIRYSEYDATATGFAGKGDKLLWHLLAKKAGPFTVEVEYAADAEEAGDTLRFHAFDQDLDTPVASTGGAFRWMPLGTLVTRSTGLAETELFLPKPSRSASLRVRAVRLIAK